MTGGPRRRWGWRLRRRPSYLSSVPRRQLVRSLLRATLTTTVLVVLYYTVPLTGLSDGTGTVGLLIGLVAFCLLVAWQADAVLRADYPGLRAVEALAAAVPLFLLVFAAAYYIMGNASPGSFSESLTRTDSLYYTVTVFATVGFGDITPTTTVTRVVTMVQMLGDIVVVGTLLRVIVGAAKAGIQRHHSPNPPSI